MGDRVLVSFKSGEDVSPTIYMHSHGGEAADWIKEAQPLMRKDDPSYAAARFAGFCASKIPGTSGIGLIDAIDLSADLRDITHGDAGVYVVDVSTGKVEAGGGYGKPFKLDPSKFPD